MGSIKASIASSDLPHSGACLRTARVGKLAKVVRTLEGGKQKKALSPSPSLSAVTVLRCTHTTSQGLLRSHSSEGSHFHPLRAGDPEEILWQAKQQDRKGKKCVSGFTAICSEPTNRIPSGRVKNTGSKISLHLNNRHVGLDSPPPLALFKQPSAACKQSLRRLRSVRIISAF